ncbi:MAG: ATP-binding cassette domain-containing protein [Deltaproteobacteria bacterium]|nr:ATP-binding cassette domain-containing protein [Deltaproteobacteria bacterium]
MSWRASIALRLGELDLDVALEGGPGVTAIMGPNGSGKTTLLRAIVGAVPVTRADVTVDERVLANTERGIDVPIEARGVGYLPQGYGLFPHLKVIENVAFGLSTGVARASRAERFAAARAMLEKLSALDLAERSVTGLSGGEKQRVALARALVREPSLLLLDEPLASLDVRHRQAVRALLARQLADWGRPALLVTHDVRDVAALDAEVVILDRGRVVQRGTLEALRSEPANPLVAELLSG